MKRIAAGIHGQRVGQQPALERLAGNNQFEGIQEIPSRLFLGPGAGLRQRLEMEQSLVAIERVAIITSSAAATLLNKNRLDTRHEILKIGRRRSRGKGQDDK